MLGSALFNLATAARNRSRQQSSVRPQSSTGPQASTSGQQSGTPGASAAPHPALLSRLSRCLPCMSSTVRASGIHPRAGASTSNRQAAGPAAQSSPGAATPTVPPSTPPASGAAPAPAQPSPSAAAPVQSSPGTVTPAVPPSTPPPSTPLPSGAAPAPAQSSTGAVAQTQAPAAAPQTLAIEAAALMAQHEWNEVFVNRGSELKLFSEVANDIPTDKSRLLNFYGVAGQGKTSLLENIIQRIDNKEEIVPGEKTDFSKARVAYNAFAPHRASDPIETLLELRNVLSENKNASHNAHRGIDGDRMPFINFDFVLAAVWNNSHRGKEPPIVEGKRFDKVLDMVTSIIADMPGALGSSVPFAGGLIATFVEHTAPWIKGKAKDYYVKTTSEFVKQLFNEDKKLLPSHVLPRFAAAALAQDVTRYTKEGERQVILFLDEMENLVNDPSVRQNYRAVTDFTRLAEGMLLVTGSRQPLPVTKNSFDPLREAPNAQVRMEGLGEPFATEYLNNHSIPQKYHEGMIDTAEEVDPDTQNKTVFPLLLNLQAQSYNTLKANKEKSGDFRDLSFAEIAVYGENFESKLDELVERLFRSYNSSERTSMEMLISARRVPEDLRKVLMEKRNVSSAVIDLMIQQRFAHKDSQGTLSFHEPFGEAVRTYLKNDAEQATVFDDTHTFLRDHYESKIKPINYNSTPQTKLENLEAFHHGVYHVLQQDGIQDALAWAVQFSKDIYYQKGDSKLPIIRPMYEGIGASVLNDPVSANAFFNKVQPSSLLATSLASNGQYITAEDMVKDVVNLVRTPSNLEKAFVVKYIDFAQIAERNGHYDFAKHFFEKALEDYQNDQGGHTHGTAILYRDLAGVCNKLGQTEEAEKYLRDSLQIKQDIVSNANHAISSDEMIYTRQHLGILLLSHDSSDQEGGLQEPKRLLKTNLEALKESLSALGNTEVNINKKMAVKELEIGWNVGSKTADDLLDWTLGFTEVHQGQSGDSFDALLVKEAIKTRHSNKPVL